MRLELKRTMLALVSTAMVVAMSSMEAAGNRRPRHRTSCRCAGACRPAALALIMKLMGRVLAPMANRPVHELASSVRSPVTYMIGSVASYWLIFVSTRFSE